ncbi:hypothetical protein BKA66DRAFT_468163 [Pyrenochaeta sp. MPI-SDFR-AT-0127]|nr:hypothetical protein BKA66DRAFT_468163 [Pyrenochaeta sp. MPI-SDFR-AT-0127]
MQLMKTWLEECKHGHWSCSEKQAQGFLPTRLLDLQATGSGDNLRLIASASLDKVGRVLDYMTLSHCWGLSNKHPITLLRGNIDNRMASIAMDDLSNTFREVIQLTRQLGIRYPLIDSLCIVQDEEEDWSENQHAWQTYMETHTVHLPR